MSLNTEIFSRADMKFRAKNALRGNWRTTLVTVLICFVCLTVLSSITNRIGAQSYYDATSIFLQFAVMVIGGLLVYGVLEYSICKYFVHMCSKDQVGFSDFMEGFSEAGRAVVAYIWQFIFVFLWCLALIPAGIAIGMAEASGVEGLSVVGILLFFIGLIFVIARVIRYTFQYMVMADAPEVGGRDALTYSVAITKGHVWDLIKLDLSFFFWALLVIVTAGLAAFYVVPYIYETNVQTYRWMRDEAFREGRLDASLLGYKKNSNFVD